MRLQEHEAADLFEAAGIPFPPRGLAATAQEVLNIAAGLGYPVVLKAQVLAGGRGLAGGVRVAADPAEAERVAEELLEGRIQGLRVERLLVASKIDVRAEWYFGIAVDGLAGRPVVLASTQGGVGIERVAAKSPEKIASHPVDPVYGLLPYQARRILRELGMAAGALLAGADILIRLYRVFHQKEALIAEINPLAVTSEGTLCALDAVLEVDDSALFRLGDLAGRALQNVENPLERRAREIGVTYVDLDGDIGLISSGAGLGMATMDMIGRRLRPANFLETGGGITEQLLYDTMALLMARPGLRAVLINIYGGINPIHEGARGIARYLGEHGLRIPVVAKALGNRQEETWEILRKAGVHVVTEVPTEKAVEKLEALLAAG